MWDTRVLHPFGKPLGRQVLLFLTSVLVTIFAYALVTAPNAHAADASWKGDSIEYDQRQYLPQPKPATTNDPTGLPEGTIIYASSTPSSGPSSPAKAYIIHFQPKTDVSVATSASYVEYTFTPPQTFTNPSNQKTINVSVQSGGSAQTTSCDSTFTWGIGWILCPVINFMSGAMDWLFGIVSGFLAVRPMQSTGDNSLFRAWSMMRNVANVAFVIVFLILIYSQLTSFGVSNYGIKKLLPRLIVGAILVNMSYWICAIAIDISNILGYSTQGIFIGMRNEIIGTEGNGWDIVNWESISGFILSGGTAVAGIGVGTYALLMATVGGAIYLLVPILIGAILSVLVALLLMAARQAIITIFVILAPLAFVAYLLPNTEKLYAKWQKTFMTMLVLFPLFSVVFGGAQLAGIAIIHNADSINLVLLGMAVQVMPLAITPLLIQFGGGLLNRFAGIVNNPNKGIVDRSRKWAQDRAGKHKDRVLGNPQRAGLNRLSQRVNQSKQMRDNWQKNNQASAENALQGTDEYGAFEKARRDIDREASIIKNRFESEWNIKAKIDTNSLERELALRISADRSSLAKNQLDTMYEEVRAGTRPAGLTFGPLTQSQTELLNSASDTSTHLALEAMKKKAAEHTTQHNTTQALLKDDAATLFDGQTARTYAGGIRGREGAETALTAAVAHERKEAGTQIDEKVQLIKHFNLDGNKRQQLALGTDVTVSKDGVSYTFEGTDAFAVEAAIEQQMVAGSEGQKIEIIKESGVRVKQADGSYAAGKTSAYASSISDQIVKTGLPAKSLIFGSKIIDDVSQGNLSGESGLQDAAVFHIMEGKISDEILRAQGTGTLEYLFETMKNRHSIEQYTSASPEKKIAFEENYRAMQASARKILDDEVNRPAVEASKRVFEKYASTP